MERRLMLTEDGSHTMFVEGFEEPYHSTHGALQESTHIFINEGLHTFKGSAVRILELGFGTGLNALLTWMEAIPLQLDIYYHAIEKYPLTESEYMLLNYEKVIDHVPPGGLNRLHSAPWGEKVEITDNFTFFKEKADFRSMVLPPHFNLIYFDAFSPVKQPELWTKNIFDSIARVSDKGAVLVTYSSKGSVRRSLISSGFEVYKIPGPPGKREMIKAIKI